MGLIHMPVGFEIIGKRLKIDGIDFFHRSLHCAGLSASHPAAHQAMMP